MNPEHTSLPIHIGSPGAADFLTPKQAAALLHVTTSTVARWAEAGKISSTTTLGGHRRYPRADIDDLLRRHHGGPDDATEQ
ncbi:helix-turn-helix domain-containing protein [Rhodococcus erythropolis]